VASPALRQKYTKQTATFPCAAASDSEPVGCLNPVEGWRSRQPNDNGKYPVTFSRATADVEQELSLPCGKCPGCRKDKAEAWGLRCVHEATQHNRNCFLTLTYADPCPPTLSKPDLQKFFKRLRKADYSIRYFACGEYGTRTKRPHYHAIIFGEDFRQDSISTGNRTYTSPKVQQIWGFGSIQIAPADPDTCFYTSGYILKADGEDDSFHVQSTRPYIGAGWLEKYNDDIARNGFITLNGVKHTPPASYLRRAEYALEFDYIKTMRSAYVKNMPIDEVVTRRERARGKEINILAKAKLRGNTI